MGWRFRKRIKILPGVTVKSRFNTVCSEEKLIQKLRYSSRYE